jgi:hypothetical protein
MPQSQRIVRLVVQGESPRQAVATEDAAAWMCPCGYGLPLIGRWGLGAGVRDDLRVDCPACGRGFFVRQEDNQDYRMALRVEQVRAEANGFGGSTAPSSWPSVASQHEQRPTGKTCLQ